MEDLRTINDAKEKEKLIASIKSLICGSSTDRTVCCGLTIVSIRFDILVFKLMFFEVLNKYSIHLDGSTQFSRHSLSGDPNLNPPVECGVGPVSRGHALGFRFVADGSDAKILDVSIYLVCYIEKNSNKYLNKKN